MAASDGPWAWVEHYAEYVSAYSIDGLGSPREDIWKWIVDATKRSDPEGTIRVLDIGAGDWTVTDDSWFSRLICGEVADSDVPRCSLEILVVEPYYPNRPIEWSVRDGVTVRLRSLRLPFWEYWEKEGGGARPFDLVLSRHGLYHEVEREEPNEERGEVLARRLFKLCAPTGAVKIIHSAGGSVEKKLKFDRNLNESASEAVRENLRRFHWTDGDTFEERLRRHFLVAKQVRSSTLHLEVAFECWDAFTRYYFRWNGDGDDPVFAEASELLRQALEEEEQNLGEGRERVVPALFYCITAYPSVEAVPRDHGRAWQNWDLLVPTKRTFPLRNEAEYEERVKTLMEKARHLVGPGQQFYFRRTTSLFGHGAWRTYPSFLSMGPVIQAWAKGRRPPPEIAREVRHAYYLYPLIMLRGFLHEDDRTDYSMFMEADALKHHAIGHLSIRHGTQVEETEDCEILFPDEVLVGPERVDAAIVEHQGELKQLLDRLWDGVGDGTSSGFLHPDYEPPSELARALRALLPKLHEAYDALFGQYSHHFTDESWEKYLRHMGFQPHLRVKEQFDRFLFLRAQLLGRSHELIFYPYWSTTTGRTSSGMFLIVTRTGSVSKERREQLIGFLGALGQCVERAQERGEEFAFARRSASAAVLSRNLSHNVGSHVTPRTSLSMLRKRLATLLAVHPDHLDETSLNSTLVHLKDGLDSYVQRKSEFLAELTTEPALSGRCVRFYQDVMLPFLKNTALIDSIAANEGFQYTTIESSNLRISVSVRHTDETPIPFFARYRDNEGGPEAPDTGVVPFAERTMNRLSEPQWCKIQNREHDVAVALPGPVGEMAFYGILENVLRNSAKHGTRKSRDVLELVVELWLTQEEDDHYRIRILDRGSIATPELVKKLNGFLKKPLVTEHGETRENAWGCAEMAISAEYLRGHGLSTKECPIRVLSEKVAGGCLIYEFEMLKARTALFVGFEPRADHDSERGRFRYIPSFDSLDAGQGWQSLARYGFVVVKAETLSTWLETMTEDEQHDAHRNLTLQVPARLLVLGAGAPCLPRVAVEVEGKDLPEGELTPWLWRSWLRGRKQPQPQWPIVNEVVWQMDTQAGANQDAVEEWAREFNRSSENEGFPYRIHRYSDQAKWSNNACRLIIDHHATLGRRGHKETSPDNVWVGLDKQSIDFNALFNMDMAEPWTLPYELLEAAHLSVLIIDERIAQRSQVALSKDLNRFFGGCAARRWHAAARARIAIVTRVVVKTKTGVDPLLFVKDEGAQLSLVIDLTGGDGAITLELSRECGSALPSGLRPDDFDFTVVHEGVFDTIRERADIGVQKIRDGLKRERTRLVIESGRGLPPAVARIDELFLPFSVVDRPLRGDYPSKLELCRRLMELTRRRKS